MKFEIRWSPDDRPMARRVDGAPMTDEDRQQLKTLLEKMERRELCWNCGGEWSLFTTDAGTKHFVCWACAKSI